MFISENDLINSHNKTRTEIKKRIKYFKTIPEEEYFNEFLFCLLTPQSNAKKCWEAVEEISKLPNFQEDKIVEILKTKTRFYKTKALRVIKGKQGWNKIKEKLKENSYFELRNWLAENVNGYGLKESSHFLRNIGKSNNQIAILDRHILRNLKSMKVIEEDKIKNKKHYFEIEERFINFAKKIKIPVDELDLLFWSAETGEIFK